MLVEIRRYEIQPGRRDDFVRFFDEEVLPEMHRAGMSVLGQFVSVEDDTVFYYLRAFADEAQRAAQTAAFYEGGVWLDHLRDRALAMETGYRVDLVVPTPGSAIR